MSQHAAILFANDAFYMAFQGRDIDAMREAWSERENITCIHPGWPTLNGRREVMSSWKAILSNAYNPSIECRHATAHLAGDVAYVLCYEVIAQGFLVSTNIFAKENGIWRMIHHQSGPAPSDFGEEEEEEENGPLVRVQ
jgi:ketosteroid isomerase-like protein